MKTCLISVLVTMILASTSSIQGQTKTKKCRFGCGSPTTKAYDLATANVSGDQIRGPAKIRADNLNVLRYGYKFNVTIAFSAAPDLFSKLLAAASPSPSAPPAQPAPTTKVTPEAGEITESKNAKVQAVLDQADRAWNNAQVPLAKARNLIGAATGGGRNVKPAPCDGDVPTDLDVTKETNRQSDCLAKQISTNATAVALVKQAGQALIALLQKSWTNPELLIGYVNQTLDPDSTFVNGINANWPDLSTTATLKQSALAWKAELADRISKFNNGLPSISGSLGSANKALSDIEQTMSSSVKTASVADRELLRGKIQRIQDEMGLIDDEMKQLAAIPALLSWGTAENQRILGAIPDLEASSTKYNDFQTAQEALISWRTRMRDLRDRWVTYKTAKDHGSTEDVNPSPFSLSSPVADCGFAFSRTKTTAFVLSRTDLMPGTTATTPETVLSVTVECTSPFTISAGVAFSNIPKREFAIQASPATPPATGTVNRFVVTDNSNFHPLPLGMIHARFREFNEMLALHGSFGMAGNFQSQAAGGTSAEFLVGPSLSLFRTMFLTPGLHIGTKTIIGGGFNVGDAVPSNITSVPLQKSYTTGFGFAITFTKP